jgi:hypothetical protein
VQPIICTVELTSIITPTFLYNHPLSVFNLFPFDTVVRLLSFNFPQVWSYSILLPSSLIYLLSSLSVLTPLSSLLFSPVTRGHAEWGGQWRALSLEEWYVRLRTFMQDATVPSHGVLSVVLRSDFVVL